MRLKLMLLNRFCHEMMNFRFSASRLQATTVKTTWNEASTDPVNSVLFRSAARSRSVVNGHAHAQV